jgi:hypothetical protein
MSENLGGRQPNKLAIAGVVAGVLAVVGGVEVVRRQLLIPEGLNEKRATTLKKGAIILTAGALALEQGQALTLAQLGELTKLNRQNTSWGVNFLEEKGFAERQKGSHGEVDHIWGTEPLMLAAANKTEFPLLRDAMQQLVEYC